MKAANRKAECPLSPQRIRRLGVDIEINENSRWIAVAVCLFNYVNLNGGAIISELMINEQIRDKEVRLVGENGEQLGIMSVKDAMKIARDANLDLVKIAPTAKPPVCKVIDYGKYRYELARKEKEAKKKPVSYTHLKILK